MQRGRVAFADRVREARRVLIVGEGTGRFIAACATALPHAQITVIDESTKMLRRARYAWKSVGGDPARVEWICADFLDWKPTGTVFDLIVTHFFLDCFPPEKMRQIIKKITLLESPDARWLLAEFCLPSGGIERWRAQLRLGTAYRLFRWLADVEAQELTPPGPLLRESGHQLLERTHFDRGMIQSDLWQRVISQ